MSNVDVQRIQLSSCNTVACMMRYVFNGMFWVFFKWEKKIGWLFLARSSKRHIGFKCFFLHSRSESYAPSQDSLVISTQSIFGKWPLLGIWKMLSLNCLTLWVVAASRARFKFQLSCKCKFENKSKVQSVSFKFSLKHGLCGCNRGHSTASSFWESTVHTSIHVSWVSESVPITNKSQRHL